MKNRKLFYARVLLTVLALLGLSSPSFAVQKGREVKDLLRWNQTVAFGETSPNSTEDSLFCSGVLIHPQVILTAAHCVFRKAGMNEVNWASQVRVYKGLGSTGTVLAKDFISVVRAHPDYLRSPNGWSDYAYAILRKPITLPPVPKLTVPKDSKFPFLYANTSGILPIMMLPGEVRSALNARQARKFAMSVGFGVDESRISGVKREGFLELEQKTSLAEVFVKADPQETNKERPELLMDPRTTGVSYPVSFIGGGDSGGPIFALNEKNEWSLLALVSRASEKEHAKPVYVLSSVRNGICWVRDDLKALKKKDPRFPEIDLHLGEGNRICDQETLEISTLRYSLEVLAVVLGVPGAEVDVVRQALRKLIERPGDKTLDLSNTYLKDVRILAKLLEGLGSSLDKKPLNINLRNNRIQTIAPFANLLAQGRINQLNLDQNNISAAEAEILLTKYKTKIRGKQKIKGERLQTTMLTDTPFKAMCDCSTRRFTSSARPMASDRECNKQAIQRMTETAATLGLPFHPEPEFPELPPRDSFPLMSKERELTIRSLFSFFFAEQEDKEVSCQSLNSELVRRKSLALEYPMLTDFSPLAGFQDLKHLSLQNQSPLNWNFLRDMDLHTLNLNNTQLTDLSVIEDMVGLEALSVEKNMITSIQPIIRLLQNQEKKYGKKEFEESGLKTLCLHDNAIKDLELLRPYLGPKGIKYLFVDKTCDKNKNPFGF